ncbi:alpha/beta hydrolase [Microlunatus parietis]|nr:alpha/beta hydrolase [Microlunatus parietis]
MFEPTTDISERLTFVPGIVYGEADGTSLLLDLLLPASATGPVTIWLHGGGWSGGSRIGGLSYWCAHLAAQGIATAAVDYRLSGDAVFPAQLHDVKAAIRWLRAHARDYGLDPARMGIWGHSAGGHLAALAGLTSDHPELEGDGGNGGVSSRVAAVAVASAPSDFLAPGGELINDRPSQVTQLFGGTVAEQEAAMRQASPLTYVQYGAPPFLIAHGTLDETVPYEQATRLRDALNAVDVPVEFIAIDDGYHNWNPKPDSTWPKVRYLEFADLAAQFFHRVL